MVVTVLVTVDEAVGNASEVGLETDDTLSVVWILALVVWVVTALGHSASAPFPAINRAIKLPGI